MTEDKIKNSEIKREDAKLKRLRIGRVLFVLIFLLLIYWLVSWFLLNSDRVKEIEQQMQDLSTKLEEQSKNTRILNSSLARFSQELAEANNALYAIEKNITTQGQVSAHDLGIIKDELKNLKSKIDNIKIKSGTYGGGYYQ